MTDIAHELCAYYRSIWPPYAWTEAELVKRGVSQPNAFNAVDVLREEAHLNVDEVDWDTVEQDIRNILAPTVPPVTPGTGRELILASGHGLYLNGSRPATTIARKHYRCTAPGSSGACGVRCEADIQLLEINDCDLELFHDAIDLTPLVQGMTAHVGEARIIRSILRDTLGGQGIYAWAGVTRLLVSESVFANIAMDAPNDRCHGAYIDNGVNDVELSGNLFYRCSSSPWQLRGGGQAHDNLAVECAGSMRFGGGDDGGQDFQLDKLGVTIDARNNVVVRGRAADFGREAPVKVSNIRLGTIGETLIVGPAGGKQTMGLLGIDGRDGAGVYGLTVNGYRTVGWEHHEAALFLEGLSQVVMVTPIQEDAGPPPALAWLDDWIAGAISRDGGEWDTQKHDVRVAIDRIRAEVGA